jgi:uncharacterized protein (TIGR02996 family)
MEHVQVDLLERVIAYPDDDAPRLAVARALRERDEPRGAFIEAQCTAAALTSDDRSRAAARVLARRLLLEHSDEWTAPLRALGAERCEFRRGFVERIAIRPADLLANGEALVRAAPIRDVALGEARVPWAALSKSPVLARLRSLDLCGSRVTVAGATALARSPHLSELEHLDVGQTHLGDAGLAALCAGGAFPALRSLALQWSDITAGGLKKLLGARSFPGLRELRLDSNKLGTSAVLELAASDLAASLVALSLSSLHLRDDGVTGLARCAAIANLARLSLAVNDLTAAAVEALRASPHLQQLRHLDVAHNRIGPRVAVALDLPALESLSLRGTDLGAEGARLIGAARTEALVHLDLSGCLLGPDDVEALADASALGRLTELNLDWNTIGPRGAAAIAASPRFARLQSLVLSGAPNRVSNAISDDGATALAASAHLERLARLDLTANGIGDRGALAIARSPHLAGVAELELKWNTIGETGGAALRERFGPLASVHHQRREGPTPPPPTPAALPHEVTPARKVPPRAVGLARLRRARVFEDWRGFVERRLITASRAIVHETIDALLGLGDDPSRDKERAILKRCIERFNRLDGENANFIDTMSRESICNAFYEVAGFTKLADEEDLADRWRDF